MRRFAIFFLAFFAAAAAEVRAGVPQETVVVISVADQRLGVVRGGKTIEKYRVSTSKFGLGDRFGSYRTPIGKMAIASKIGGNLVSGAVLKGRRPTGEVLAPNAPGRDPIVSRIMVLEGCEERNRNARSRGIYIHGTTEEKRIGKPVSYGCIRMRSRDVIELYRIVKVGTRVVIATEKLSAACKALDARPVMVADSKRERQTGALYANSADSM